MERADVELMRRVMEQISQSAMEFGKVILPILQKFKDDMNTYYGIIHPILRKEYESAGSPLGFDDEGMWEWLRGKIGRSDASSAIPIDEISVRDVLKLRDYMKGRNN